MTAELKKPDLVIWDWDGTLVNTAPIIYEAHNYVRVAMGFDAWSESEFKEISYYSTDEIYPKLYGENVDDAKRILYDFFDRYDPVNTPFLNGSHDVVSYLSSHDVPMVIVSNKQDHVLQKELAVASFRDGFLSAVGAGAASKDKPHADPVLLAIEKAGISNDLEHVWFIGDTQTDVDCARSLDFSVVSIILGDLDSQKGVRGYDFEYPSLPLFLKSISNLFE